MISRRNFLKGLATVFAAAALPIKAGADFLSIPEGEHQSSDISMPPGMLTAFAGDKIPEGWVLCDGRPLCTEKFSRLYDVIGQAYSNELPVFRRNIGVNEKMKTKYRELLRRRPQFNVPDLRAKVFFGPDDRQQKNCPYVIINWIIKD